MRIPIAVLCVLFALLLSSSKTNAQSITPENLQENLDKVKNDINAEHYETATELSYNLLRYLKTNQAADRDSTYFHLTKTYYNLTRIYLFNDLELSVKYADSTIAMALKTNNPSTKQSAYSIKYYALYDVKGEELTLDFLADKCIEYSLKAENDKMLGESYMHKCNSQVELGHISEAATYCDKAIEAFEKISDVGYLTSVYNNIGNVFTKSSQFERALHYYKIT